MVWCLLLLMIYHIAPTPDDLGVRLLLLFLLHLCRGMLMAWYGMAWRLPPLPACWKSQGEGWVSSQCGHLHEIIDEMSDSANALQRCSSSSSSSAMTYLLNSIYSVRSELHVKSGGC